MIANPEALAALLARTDVEPGPKLCMVALALVAGPDGGTPALDLEHVAAMVGLPLALTAQHLATLGRLGLLHAVRTDEVRA